MQTTKYIFPKVQHIYFLTQYVKQAFDLQKKAEPHSNAQIMDTTVIKHSNTGGLETAETSPILDIEELDKISVSHTTEKLEIKQEEAKEKEEVTEIQSVKTATESMLRKVNNFSVLCEFNLYH